MSKNQPVQIEKDSKPMTLGQASAVITGCGVGGGVMAVPYLVTRVGVPLAIVILLLAFAFSILLNIMFADLAIKNGCKGQTTDIINNLVLKGKLKKVGSIILFVMLASQLIVSNGAYISGAGELISNLFQIPSQYAVFGKLIFFVVAAIVLFFSLKLLGIVEQASVFIMYGALIALLIGSCLNIKNTLPVEIQAVKDVFGFFGVAMLSFASFYSVPQVVSGLNGDVKKIKQSIFLGTLYNFLIIAIITVFSILSSAEITPLVIEGWSKGIGAWANIVGTIFSVFAFFTSFWALSFALRDMIVQQFKISEKLSLIFTLIPSLLFAIIPLGNFSNFISITSAICGIAVAIFVIPGFYYQKKINHNQSIMGIFGSLPFEIATLIAFLLMGVGSIISIIP